MDAAQSLRNSVGRLILSQVFDNEQLIKFIFN